MEMAIMKEEFYYTHKYLKRGDMARHARPHGEAPAVVRRQRGQGKTWTEPLLWFPWEGMGETT